MDDDKESSGDSSSDDSSALSHRDIPDTIQSDNSEQIYLDTDQKDEIISSS